MNVTSYGGGRFFRRAVFVGLLALPVALYFVPIDWLNEQHSICLFKNIFGTDCWGCGITRAVLSVLQCRFADAFHFNKLITVVFPLLIHAWVKALVRYRK